jgi:lipopolysaccharide export system permease protein
MRLLSRHILRSLAAPFVWGLLALTGLLLLNSLARLIDTFGGKGLSVAVMTEAIILHLPALMTLTLPMAILVAALYAYTTLAADLEMVAMYASGISVWKMVRPALVLATGVAAVDFLLFDQIVPVSNTRLRTLQYDVERTTPTVALRAGELNRLPPSHTLRARTIDPETGRMTDVTIWDLGRYDGRRVIHADSGRMAASTDQIDLLLTLYDGEVVDLAGPDPTKVERTGFRVNRIRLGEIGKQFERSADQLERGDRELSGCELLDGIERLSWERTEGTRLREQLTRRDLRQLAGLAPLPPQPLPERPTFAPHCGAWRQVNRAVKSVLLPAELEAQAPQAPAIAQDTLRPKLGLGRRKNTTAAARRDSLDPGGPTDAIAQDTTRLAAPVESLAMPVRPDSVAMNGGFLVDPGQFAPPAAQDGLVSTIAEVNGAKSSARDAQRRVREYAVEYHKKFAIPITSFCFVLIGVALALKYPRSGIGLVVGGSLVIFLAFYILLIGGENLANKGVITPAAAMYAPVGVLSLVGLAAVASANREMGTARTSSLVDVLRDLFRRRG